MHRARIAPLLVLLVAGLILSTGCKKPKAPTITLTAPTDSVAGVGDQVTFTATVSNPDNVATTVTWTKTGGTFNQDTGLAVRWTAPSAFGRYTVSAIVSGAGITEKDTAAKTIVVQTWVRGLGESDNTDHVDIPNPGDTYSPILFTNNGSGDDSVPAGALVDSVWAEIDITYDGSVPDSYPPLNVWLKAPDGSQVQLWNETQAGDPSGEYLPSLLSGLRDKPVTGTWKLAVQARTGEVDGWIDDFNLMVWYRKLLP